MKTVVFTAALLLLLSQVTPGNTEKCWKCQGTCRDQCIKDEKVYIFCRSGKLCCVKPKNVPQLSQDSD
ncbi:beta-defensin 122-like [Peromyscus leucopus]|uniref:beta-defensin 122-like n=1 Tax=Peromyscus leucopus TaxID=10041 RepID=UPI0010A1361C|nr:beta-defensin 122-like [Peromyscus leucopus]